MIRILCPVGIGKWSRSVFLAKRAGFKFGTVTDSASDTILVFGNPEVEIIRNDLIDRTSRSLGGRLFRLA